MLLFHTLDVMNTILFTHGSGQTQGWQLKPENRRRDIGASGRKFRALLTRDRAGD